MSPEQLVAQEETDRDLLTWWIAAGIVLVALACCAGVVATVAVPQFQKYLRRSKVAEAEATMESTMLAVEQYYDLKRKAPDAESIPGVGHVVRTSETVPAGGDKTVVDPTDLSEPKRRIWKQLNWPSSRTEMYFQYTYRARETEQGVQATIEARADFVEGGPKHTITRKISVRDGELEVAPSVEKNAFK